MGTYRLALLKMLIDDLRQDRFVQSAVPDTLRIDHHDRSEIAGVEATGTSGENMARARVHPRVFQAAPEVSSQLRCARRRATWPMAEQNVMAVGRDDRPVLFRGTRFMSDRGERGRDLRCSVNQLYHGVGHLGLPGKGLAEDDLG